MVMKAGLGDKVKVKNTEAFNDQFVRAGDIAEIIEINEYYGEVRL